MKGIQFVIDGKGRKVAVQIDLRKYGAIWEDFWDGLVSESRRKEKGIPYEKVKADLVKRGRLRDSAKSREGSLEVIENNKHKIWNNLCLQVPINRLNLSYIVT